MSISGTFHWHGTPCQNSDVDWFKDIPTDWNMVRLKYLATEPLAYGANEAALEDDPNFPRFIRITDIKEDSSLRSETFKSLPPEVAEPYLLQEGDILLARSGATVGKTFIYRKEWGQACFASYLIRFRCNCNLLLPDFLFFFTQSDIYWLQIREGTIQATIQNFSAEKYGDILIPLPPLAKQQAIADYLDRETAKIDRLISAKERLLELLAEKRCALITNTVIRGLNPDVAMCDSGVEWLGKIPKHWEVEFAKWLFQEIDERSTTAEEELLTVSHLTGVTLRSEKDVNMFMAETMEGYKICQSGDLVINTLWAWMGAMGVALQNGIVSPAYHVYRPCGKLHPLYIDFLVRIPIFAQEVTRYSKGVWSSRLRLYPEEFFQVLLPVPPIQEQEEIVNYLIEEIKKLDNLTVAAKHTIELLHERRAALIAAAVTGQTSVIM